MCFKANYCCVCFFSFFFFLLKDPEAVAAFPVYPFTQTSGGKRGVERDEKGCDSGRDGMR